MTSKDAIRLIGLSNDLQTVSGGLKILIDRAGDECDAVESPNDACHFCDRFQKYATGIYLFLEKLEIMALDLRAEVAT